MQHLIFPGDPNTNTFLKKHTKNTLHKHDTHCSPTQHLHPTQPITSSQLLNSHRDEAQCSQHIQKQGQVVSHTGPLILHDNW